MGITRIEANKANNANKAKEAREEYLLNIPKNWKFLFSGKVRDVYEVDKDCLAFVASDRVSAFDWVLPSSIPDKGKILNQISRYWFKEMASVAANHWAKDREVEIPKDSWPRTMMVRRAQVYPFEFIVRGHLAGSLWKNYQNSTLPKGLKFGDSIPGGPILTPTTKEKTPGRHDEDVSWGDVRKTLGAEIAEKIRLAALKIFSLASTNLRAKGIVLVDTKFEFGEINGEIVVVDEILTPDSSRFWWAKDYENLPRRDLAPLDKQVIRDYLERELLWDKKPPVPALSAEVISKTREIYLKIFRAITGEEPVL